MTRIDNETPHKEVKLDVKDKKILDILSENSRTPISQIAKKVELSRDVIGYRIKRFEKLGLITRFYPRLNFLKLKFNTYHIFLVIDGSKRDKELIEKVKSLDETLFLIEYSDRWDLEIVLLSKNINKLDKLITELQAEFSDTIIERSELLEIKKYQSILFSYYFNKDIPKLNKKEQETIKSDYSIDEKDISIIEELCGDSRKSTYDIAKNVNLSADAIGIRIKKLVSEEIIRKFTILPNLSKLDYKWYTFCIKMNFFDKENEKQFKKFIENHPGIIRSTKTFGDYDILMYIVAQDQKEYHRLIKEIRTTFPHIIKYYITFIAYKEHYFNPFPNILKNLSLK